jgi:hypothetical protein
MSSSDGRILIASKAPLPFEIFLNSEFFVSSVRSFVISFSLAWGLQLLKKYLSPKLTFLRKGGNIALTLSLHLQFRRVGIEPDINILQYEEIYYVVVCSTKLHRSGGVI